MASLLKRATGQMAGERTKHPPHEARVDKVKYWELQTLHEIGEAILTSPDLQTILEQILDKALRVGSFDVGVMYLLERNGTLLNPVASRGYLDPENVCGRSTDPKDRTTGMILVGVISDQGAHVVENVAQAEGLRAFKKEGVRSAIAVPVRAGDEVLGVIQLGSRTPRRFQPYEVHLLRAIGGQMGIAVQKARLSEKTKRRALEISALNAITTAVSASLNLDEILDKSLQAALLFTGMEIGYIRLLEGNPPKFALKAHKGISPALVETLQQRRTRLGGRAEQVLTTKRSLVLENVQSQHSESVESESPSQNFNSTAWVPILSREQVIGIINIATDGTQTFSTNQISLLESIGASIGVAIENARLFEQVKRKSREFEALVKINRDVAALLDLNTLLPRIAEQAEQLLKMDGANFRLVEGEHLVLRSSLHSTDINFRQKLRLGESLSGKVIRENRILAIKNVVEDPTIIEEHRERLSKAGYHAYLGVPLQVGTRVLGAINLLSRTEREFLSDEIDLMNAFAAQAAIAVENAQLFEQTKKQTAALERANKVKAEFLSFISHELRTPLSVIMGCVTVTHDNMLGEINQKQKETLEKVMRNSNGLLTMIDSLLEATRIEAEAVSVESHEFNLRVFFEEIRSSYSVPPDKDVTLVWDYPGSLPPMRSDRQKLRHILKNLIDNAIKFTGKGDVTISARYFSETESVQVRIVDMGIGIPEDEIPLIFEKFYQVDSSSARAHGGIGLGLSIVKTFTEMLGGTIEVESKPKGGSTFTVTLPVIYTSLAHSGASAAK